MQFKVGDKVRFLNEVGEGKIVSIVNEGRVVVENEDGFDVEYLVSDLVPTSSGQDYKLDGIEYVESVNEKINAETKEEQLREFTRKFNHLEKPVDSDIHEIDLHIEELIDSHRGLSNAQILSIQMTNFTRSLNVAMRAKARKLIVIHGVGEGVLKAEIRKELFYHYPELSHHDADYRKYGYGATEILLRGN